MRSQPHLAAGEEGRFAPIWGMQVSTEVSMTLAACRKSLICLDLGFHCIGLRNRWLGVRVPPDAVPRGEMTLHDRPGQEVSKLPVNQVLTAEGLSANSRGE